MPAKTARCLVSLVSLVLTSVGCHAPEPEVPPPSPAAAAPAGSVASGPSASPSASASAPPAAATAASPSAEFPKTPPELQVPPNSHLVLKAHAKGVQIYEC